MSPKPAAKASGVTTLDLSLTDTQQVEVFIAPVDAKGNPAPIDGVPVYVSSDPTVATVKPRGAVAPDFLTADIIAVSAGVCRVVVTADADLGTGVVPITGTFNVTITGGQAVAVDVSAGAPTPQPGAPPAP